LSSLSADASAAYFIFHAIRLSVIVCVCVCVCVDICAHVDCILELYSVGSWRDGLRSSTNTHANTHRHRVGVSVYMCCPSLSMFVCGCLNPFFLLPPP